jgi:hypothetical protein
MMKSAKSTSRLDRVAMALSGICVVHCIVTAVLLALVSAAGGFLGSPIIHEVGLSLAMVLGAVALGRGLREHGSLVPSLVGAVGLAVMGYALTQHEGHFEPVLTVAGVLVLAVGHRLNLAARQSA